jgi:hypothetical protein
MTSYANFYRPNRVVSYFRDNPLVEDYRHRTVHCRGSMRCRATTRDAT